MRTRSKKLWAVVISALMLFSLCTPITGVLSLNVKANAASHSEDLIGRFFSTDNKWEDTQGNGAGLGWVIGDYPSDRLADGFYYLNSCLKIDHTAIFENVNASTGLTLAYTYRPTQNSDHHHLFSFGYRDAGQNNINGDSIKNHFYVSATTSWFSNGYAPVVGYVDGNGVEHIKATPKDAPAFASGKVYDVVIRITSSAITYWINGMQYDASYAEEGGAGYLDDFLNEISTYQYNYVGRSRWNTGNKWGTGNNEGDADFSGYVKDMRIYGSALSANEILIDEAYETYSALYGSADLTAALTQTDDLNKFNAVAYHTVNEATGAYSNLVYAPYDQTNFVGNGGDYKEIGAIYFKIITPSNIVMVYDGVHDVYSPIELETLKHDKAAVSNQRLRYVESQTALLPLAQYWYGYQDGGGNNYQLWAGPQTGNWFSHVADGAWDVGQDNKNTPRFWWNKLVYTGSGDQSAYYEQYRNIAFSVCSPYENWGNNEPVDSLVSESNYLVINYKPVYDALPSALACYNEIKANEWMYTEESLSRAKATIAQIVTANPHNTAYTYGTDATAAVQNCAVNIQKAVALLGAAGGNYSYGYEGLELVKNTGNVYFVDDEGTLLKSFENVEYGTTPDASTVSTAKTGDAYVYTFTGWDPAVTVVSDAEKTYTATYSTAPRMYDINFYSADGDLIATKQVAYGTTPEAPTIPAKDPDDTYHYTGAWSPAVTAVTGPADYTVLYNGVSHTGGEATCTAKAECEVCHQPYGNLAQHDYSVLQYDGTDHWYKCANCTAIDGKTAHTGGIATCTVQAECEICHQPYGNLAQHDYSVLQYDGTDHWYKCANCTAIDGKTAHTGGTATCTAKAECEVCHQPYGSTLDHDFSVLQYDGTDHWYKCANCTAIDGKTVHTGGEATCTAKAECEVCHQPYGSTLDHDFSVLQYDGTDHWYKCANCTAIDGKTAHTGGTATCTVQAECEICHQPYGSTLDHDFSVLQYDGTDHWYKCANCTAIDGKTAHTGGTATCTAKAECEVCHQPYGNFADHVYGDFTSNGNGTHTKVCANCPEGTDGHSVTENCSGGEATCSAKAICSVCSQPYGETTDHNYCITQFNDENHWKKCNGCNATTPAEPHTGGEATCMAKAKCTVCNTEYGGLGNHDYGAWIEETPATCTENGEKAHYHCSVCEKDFDADYQEIADLVIPATGEHTYGEWIAETPATCTVNGMEAHYQCSVCLKYFDADHNEVTAASLTIAAHHSPVYVEETAATDTENGTKAHFHCEVCGKNYREEACVNELTDADLLIPATGTPEEPAEPDPMACPLCGEHHATTIFGRVTTIVHMIIYIIMHFLAGMK